LTPKSQESEAATPASAILIVLIVCLLFSVLDTSAKYLVVNGVAAPFAVWVRYAVHLVLVMILYRAWANPQLYKMSSVSGQVVRGLFLFGSTIFNFVALQTMQLAETVSIYFFAPMVITALAGPVLGERVGWRRWLAVLVGFIGVLVITRPGAGTFSIGYLFSIASMLCYAFYLIMTRKMGANETTESLIFYSALVPTVLFLPTVPLYGEIPDDPILWGLLLLVGLIGGFGHWLLIKAYKQATASALAPYPYSQIIWMTALGWFVFGDFPDGWTLVGSLIIVCSGLYIVQREHRVRQREKLEAALASDDLAKKL
jgi:drug/metabolite transporter (DMT)-like permease